MSEVKEEVKAEAEKVLPVIIETCYGKDFFQENCETWLASIRGSLTKFDVLVVYLNSMGGEIHIGRAAMEALHSYGKKVVWISELLNGSLATVIPLLNDSLRLAYPSSRFLVHSSYYTYKGDAKEVEKNIRLTEEADLFWDQVYIDGIGLTKKELKNLTAFENMLMAKEFMNLGTKGGLDGLILKRLENNDYLCECRGGIKKIINIVDHKSSDVPNLPEYKGDL